MNNNEQSQRDNSIGRIEPHLLNPITGRRTYYLVIGALFLLGLALGYLAFKNTGPMPITIEWTTANELNTAGFYIYRGEEPDKIDHLVNEQIIPASTDPINGSQYQFVDTTVELGKTYYYELREVNFEGNVSKFGPINATTQPGGRVELFLAVILIAIGVLGIFSMIWLTRRPQ